MGDRPQLGEPRGSLSTKPLTEHELFEIEHIPERLLHYLDDLGHWAIEETRAAADIALLLRLVAEMKLSELVRLKEIQHGEGRERGYRDQIVEMRVAIARSLSLVQAAVVILEEKDDV